MREIKMRGENSIGIALQLYTVREALKKDFAGTLKRVKEIGYGAVQLSGEIPLAASKLKEILERVGLKPVGIHTPLERLEKNLEKEIKFAKGVGVRDLLVPYLSEERRKTKEDWLKTAKLLNDLGGRCRTYGMCLGYHNHSFEFVKFNGEYALDLLYKETKPENLFAELDTYWIKHGGEDPVKYIQKYKGRCRFLHLKDMGRDGSFKEIGQGILNWSQILGTAQKSGVEWWIVEQDICPEGPFQSIKISLDFLKNWLEK